MALFRVGSIVATMGLNVGNWNRSVSGVLRQTFHIRQSLNMVLKDVAAVGRMFALVGSAGLYFGKRVADSFIGVASSMELTHVGLTQIMKSSDKAGDFMNQLVVYASKVPFTVDQISKSALTMMAAFGGDDKLTKAVMPAFADLAAYAKSLGMTFEETLANFNLMVNGGIAAADAFRQHGITTVLGFDPNKVKKGEYGGKDSLIQMMKSWGDPNSIFRGMTKKLMNTWEGMTSNMSDNWFMLRKQIMEAGLFDLVKSILGGMNRAMSENKKEIADWVTAHKEAIITIASVYAGMVTLSLGFGLVSNILPPLVTLLQGTVVALAGIAGSKTPVVTALLAQAKGFVSLIISAGLTLAAIVAFIGSLYVLRAVVNQNMPQISYIWEDTTGKMAKAFEGLTGKLKTVYEQIMTEMGDFVKDVDELLSNMGAGPAEKGILGALAKALVPGPWLFAPLKKLFGPETMAKVMPIVEAFSSTIAETLVAGPILPALGVNTEKVTYGLTAAFDDASKQMADDMKMLTDTLGETFPLGKKLVDSFVFNKGDGATWADNFFGEMFDPSKLTSAMTKADEAMARELENMMEEIKKYRLDLYPMEKFVEDTARVQDFVEQTGSAMDAAAMAVDIQKRVTEAMQPGEKMITNWMAVDGLMEQRLKPKFMAIYLLNKQIAIEAELTKRALTDVDLGIDPNIKDALSWMDQGDSISAKIDEFTKMDKLAQDLIERRILDNELNNAGWDIEKLVTQEKQKQVDLMDELASRTLKDLSKGYRDPNTSVEKKGVISKAVMQKFKTDFEALVIDPILHAGNALASIGAKGAGAMLKFLGGAMKIGLQFADILMEIPMMMSMMADTSIAAGAKIAIAMHLAFNIIALIADAIMLVISLFKELGGSAKEELSGIGKVIEKIKEQSDQWANSFTDSIIQMAKTGEKTFKEFAQSVIEDIFRISFTELIVTPAIKFIGNQIPGFASGAAFSGMGVVDTPTMVNTKSGPAVMGEAGPEAIMPLYRGANNELGVKMSGRSSSGMVVNVHAAHIPKENIAVNHSVDSDGQAQLDIMIHESVRKGIARGRFTGDLMTVFSGLQRRTT